MSDRETSNSGEFEGEPGPEVPGEDSEISEALSELERVEAKRRNYGILLGIAAVGAVVGAILLAAEYRHFLFQPEMPIEENERKILRRTDDPQCRRLIEEVTEVGNDYYVLESKIEQTIPGDDAEAIRNVDRKLATLKERLKGAEELADEANLRYEKSQEELDKWFSYTHYEIDILRDVIDNQLAELPPEPEQSGDAGIADSGTPTEDPSGRSDGRTPEERRDGAMVELHEAFENFRVWHSGDTHKHPCGDHEEGEQPWRPDDWSTGRDAETS